MIQANIHEAKTNLSKLIEKASRGEEVIIAKSGVPIATLTKFVPVPHKRIAGQLKGKIWIADNFCEEDSDINQLFSSNETASA